MVFVVEVRLYRFKGYLFNFKSLNWEDIPTLNFQLLFLSPCQLRITEKIGHNKCCNYDLYLTNYSLLAVYLTTLLVIYGEENQKHELVE